MDVSSFEASVAAAAPPSGLSRALEALWHERRGDWDAAHHIAQDIDTEYGSWVHAYLHRREGHQSNAAYWYRRAGALIGENRSWKSRSAASASAARITEACCVECPIMHSLRMVSRV
jgi:hypothetical protein